jgi:hypothetical protein
MRSRAQIVVFQPLPVVESQLWDVVAWPTFLGRLDSAVRTTHERYTVQIRRWWYSDEAVIRVRWRAKDHKVVWQTEQGPPWSGEFCLTPLSRTHTAIALSMTPVGTGPTAWVSHWFSTRDHGETAALARLKQRLDMLPHHGRLPGPRPGTNADLAKAHRLDDG